MQLSGLTSIPRCVIIKPKNLPPLTQKVKKNSSWGACRICEALRRPLPSLPRVVYALGLDDHVIDINFDVLCDFLLENSVHQSLLCSACIIEAKGHDPVAKVGILGDECCFILVWSMHPIWLYQSKRPGNLAPRIWTFYRLVCQCWAKEWTNVRVDNVRRDSKPLESFLI